MNEQLAIPGFLLELPAGNRRCTLEDGRRAFVKVRRDKPADFFAAEARGLDELARAAAMRVPQVFHVWNHGIAIEDLGAGSPQRSDWQQAGRALAQLHANTSDHFGFDADGWCGDSAQDNTRDNDGFRFFAERRLLPQARRALDKRRLSGGEYDHVKTLCGHLPDYLPRRPAVLVHGDLWTGNLHACANGELALIDGGAVHYGWADSDLAMLTLFGEPPRDFFDAYERGNGTDSGWREYAPLLNLYHLLNHLNLFGTGYLGAVRGVLERYA